jgi:hypothetical protein
MLPTTKNINPIDATEWAFHNIKYIPEQQIEFMTPFGNKIKIENIATGPGLISNPIYKLTVDDTEINRVFTSTGDLAVTYFNAIREE